MFLLKTRARVRDEDYIYASARAKAREASFMGGDGMERLAAMRDYDAALRFLSENGFELIRDKEGNVNVEAMLDGYLERAYALVNESVPDRDVFAFLRYGYDCHNLKSAIKAEFRNEDFGRLYMALGRFTEKDIADMVAKRDFSKLPKEMGKAAKKAISVYAATKDPQQIDILLDKACYSDMLKTAESYSQKSFTALVKTKIDLVNLLTFVRVLRMGQGAEESFFRFFLEGGSLGEKWFAAAFKDGKERTSRALSGGTYAPLSAFDSLSLAILEKRADDIYIASVKKEAFATYGAEVIAAFLVKREFEAKNIRIILAAKKAGLDSALVQERLRVL